MLQCLLAHYANPEGRFITNLKTQLKALLAKLGLRRERAIDVIR